MGSEPRESAGFARPASRLYPTTLAARAASRRSTRALSASSQEGRPGFFSLLPGWLIINRHPGPLGDQERRRVSAKASAFAGPRNERQLSTQLNRLGGTRVMAGLGQIRPFDRGLD